jgi:single stranded DNA-binding protein (ssb)
LGKDPDIRTFETGVKKASFTLATSEIFKDKEGNRTEVTEWHNIVCWRNLAEIAEKYLSKGKQIYLEGKLRTRSWEDNGIKRYITEIEANTFTMLGAKSDNDSPVVEKVENRGNNLTPPDIGTPPDDTNDLPF